MRGKTARYAAARYAQTTHQRNKDKKGKTVVCDDERVAKEIRIASDNNRL